MRQFLNFKDYQCSGNYYPVNYEGSFYGNDALNNSEEKYLVILKFLPQSVSLYIHWSIIMQDQGCCPCDARSQDRENSHFFGLSVCSVAQLLEREGGSFGPQEMACSVLAT